MKLRSVRKMLSGALLIGASLLAAPAYSVIISGDVAGSTEQTGATFTAELTYQALSSTEALLSINLNNTSDPSGVDGFLTAFVFNNPGDLITASSLVTAPASWTQLGLGDNSVSGNPFGQFDLGASSTGDFEGGGNPNNGLGAGTGALFVFDLDGVDLDTLTDQSFLSEFSTGAAPGEGAQFFVARFRGLVGDASDKVPAIPEPSTYAMLLAGLGLLIFGVRRTRRH